MLQTIEELAELSVGRACGFAALAISTFMAGLSGDIGLALRTGGLLTLIACLVLAVKAGCALRRPYKRTELWLMLKPADRPEKAIAQQIIGRVLRQTYLRFAMYTAGVSAGMLGTSLLLPLIKNA